MSIGLAPPHLSVPTVRDTRRLFLGCEKFAGTESLTHEWRGTGDVPLACVVNIGDIAPGSDIFPRVIWSTTNTTTTNSITWRVRLAKLPLGSVNADGVALTALDTTIAASNPVATSGALIQTAQGTKKGGILALSTDFLKIAVDATAVSGLAFGGTVAGDRILFWGVILEYQRNAL